MAKINNEIETVVFQALSHPMRRTIIQLLETNPNGLLYTELITELGLPTGKMNYHLEQLEGLIEKNPDHHYILSPLGKKALIQLKQLKNDVTDEDTRCLKIAEKTQKASLEPTLKSFIIVGIVASLVVIVGVSAIIFVGISAEDFPPVMLLFASVGLIIEVGVLGTLVYAFKRVPQWLRRIERRFLST